MRRIFIGLLLLTGFFAIVPATQAETITQTTAQAENLGLYGGTVRYIAKDQVNNIIYIGTYSPNGVFLSKDGGVTWLGMPSDTDFGEPRGVAVDSNGTAYALFSDGLYSTTDQGTTWTELGSDSIGQYAGTLVYKNGKLMVGRSDGGVSVSSDNGATWATATVQASTNILGLGASADATTVYAITDDNTTTTLYRSADGGGTWSVVSTTGVTSRFSSIGVDPSNASHLLLIADQADQNIYQSTNGGSTWSANSNVTPYATYIDWSTTGVIYLGVDVSRDNGVTWSQLNQATPTSRVSGVVMADPTEPTTLYGASFAAFAKSTDSGATWTDLNNGITAVTVYDMSQSTDKNTIWAATNAGLAKTTNFLDAEATWEFPIFYDSYPQAVWVNPATPTTVVIGGYQNIYVSIDGGTTWTTSSGWDTNYAVQQIVAASDNTTLYAAAAYQNYTDTKTGGVYMSTDGGLTWTSLAFPDGAVQSLALASDGTLYAGAGLVGVRANGPTGVYTYVAGTWSKLTGSPEKEVIALAIDPRDESIIYATAGDFDTYGSDSDTVSGLYRSTDSGVTWTRITAGLEEANNKFLSITTQDKGTATTLYLGGADKLTTAGTIYKSTNGGDTWDVYYTGLKNESFYYLLFDGLLSAQSRGAYSLKATTQLKWKKTTASAVLQVKLTERSTKQNLKKKKVVLYQKVNTTWQKVKTMKTNKQGVVSFGLGNRTGKFQTKWKPNAKDREEYLKAVSKVTTVK